MLTKLEVPPSGPTNAPLFLLGEAPGEWEERSRVPFVGPAGKLLSEWLNAVGLNRSLCRIDNVYRLRPPGNELAKGPRLEVEASARLLHKRLAKLQPKVIIPMGNYALRALMRKPLWGGPEAVKITNWRGSILTYPHPTLGPVLVLPTLHPAVTFRKPAWASLILADWRKVAWLLKCVEKGELPQPPKREHLIEPKRSQVKEFEARLEAAFEARPRGARLSFDIETNPKARQVICVGFALDAERSITLKWEKWRKTIKRWLEHPIKKVAQNYAYDCYWMAMHGIQVRNMWDDTLAMHHCLRPSFPHSLAVQASLYTLEPYWKESPKDEDNLKAMRTPYRALARYNGQDVCVTWELWKRHLEELKNG